MSVQLGQVAPSFRLPSGQGRETGPEDYRGRSNVLVWFTKGMGCPFCRQHMSQIVRGYPSFQALNAEVLEVTATSPDRGRLYVSKFNIPFPYLCDPGYSVQRAWGLEVRSHSLGWYATALIAGAKLHPPATDFGKVEPSLREFPGILADSDMGFYILDKAGVVRYALAGPYLDDKAARQIPSNDEIVRELERCESLSDG
jgi:peroxiredoxin